MGFQEESLKLCPDGYKGRNYQKELEEVLKKISEDHGCDAKGKEAPVLLLHSCCAPCSSYVISYLSDHFRITVFYFNPNITEQDEYNKRVEEQKKFIREFKTKNKVDFIEGRYDPEEFLKIAKGLEKEPEGGRRCAKCFRLRLEESARMAKEIGADYFTTTLTISPVKSAPLINSIGDVIGKAYGVKYLFSDFKKNDGYKKSVELSGKYRLYRQDYCGCSFSKERLSASDSHTGV